jgi:hypothetical protein
MKELLTKTFWQDVKRTFDDARADTMAKSVDSQAADVPAPLEATQVSGTPPEGDVP